MASTFNRKASEMSRKQTLTVEEIKDLLIVRFNANQSKQEKLQARIQQELGIEVQEESPEAITIRNKIYDWFSDTLARRLKRNRHTTPLLSSRDFVRLIPLVLDEIEKSEGKKLDVEDRKVLEKFMKPAFENTFEAAYAMVLSRKNIYEEHWRWVTIVLGLAAERGVLPTELFALENITDEITRRMFTKKQFVTISRRGVSKLLNIETYKKLVIQPLLNILGEEERRGLEQEFETELMPQLLENAEKAKKVINTWLAEEVGRIYAAA